MTKIDGIVGGVRAVQAQRRGPIETAVASVQAEVRKWATVDGAKLLAQRAGGQLITKGGVAVATVGSIGISSKIDPESRHPWLYTLPIAAAGGAVAGATAGALFPKIYAEGQPRLTAMARGGLGAAFGVPIVTAALLVSANQLVSRAGLLAPLGVDQFGIPCTSGTRREPASSADHVPPAH